MTSSQSFAAVQVPLFWMKMLTVSLVCSCVCGYNVRERGKDWVYIRADVLCMLVCMWVRCLLSAEQAGHSSIAGLLYNFHFCNELNFLSLSVHVENKKKKRPSTKPRPKPNAQKKKEKIGEKQYQKIYFNGRLLIGIDNWLPALLLQLSPVLSRPVTRWMGWMLLSVHYQTRWRKHTPSDVIEAVFQ